MKRSESHRTTQRWLNRKNWWDDERHSRFVVHRRIVRGGRIVAERRTSIRYNDKTHTAAARTAEREAERLRDWPADKLKTFEWKT